MVSEWCGQLFFVRPRNTALCCLRVAATTVTDVDEKDDDETVCVYLWCVCVCVCVCLCVIFLEYTYIFRILIAVGKSLCLRQEMAMLCMLWGRTFSAQSP
jgi:hypothetical protein